MEEKKKGKNMYTRIWLTQKQEKKKDQDFIY